MVTSVIYCQNIQVVKAMFAAKIQRQDEVLCPGPLGDLNHHGRVLARGAKPFEEIVYFRVRHDLASQAQFVFVDLDFQEPGCHALILLFRPWRGQVDGQMRFRYLVLHRHNEVNQQEEYDVNHR